MREWRAQTFGVPGHPERSSGGLVEGLAQTLRATDEPDLGCPILARS